MSLSSGTRLGPYEILIPIGAGGMGEVYRARDTKLNRDVALKVMQDFAADGQERVARFQREAMVLASLNHPHIAQVFGFEDSDGVHALVMELVEGPTLADRIARGPVPVSEALPIARQIAEALEAAHEKGIVHRDLKPANVKVRDDGTVKVLDFGLAKALSPAGAGAVENATNSPTLTAQATQLGVILGTAAYMAPEQAKGRAVDRRADIWAFGVVLFEMLTGERAFKGDDISDVIAAVLRQEIDWAALPSDVPPNVRRLLRRCLERDPKRRLRDIGDAFLDIDAPLENEPAPAAAASPAARPTSPWLPWLAAAIVAAGSVTWVLVRTPPAAPAIVTRAEFTTSQFAGAVAISHDGTRLAYSSLGTGMNPKLVLRSMDQFEGKTIPGSEGGAFPVFSPDGQWIAYESLGSPLTIRKIPVTGGSSITLCEGAFFSGGAWGDDNTIVFSGTSGLMRVSAGGGTPEPLTRLDTARGETAHGRPQFLPDGRVLFTIRSANGSDIALLDLKTGTHRIVAKGGNNARYVASGHLLYERSGTLFALPFDLTHLAVTGQEAPVIEGVSTMTPDGAGDYSVSDAGLLVYSAADTTGQGTTLAWIDRKGVTQALPGQSRQQWGTGRLSPDGRRLADGIHTDHGSDIWVLDVERGAPTRLTFDGGSDSPIWTPDGRRLVYASAIDGKFGVYSVPADGSSKPERLLETRSLAAPSSFTPDGRLLLYDQEPTLDKPRQIFVMALPAGGRTAEPRPLHPTTGAAERDGQVSPDGKWVSYESYESGQRDVYVQPFPGPGAKARVSENGGDSARWARDGRTLYFWVRMPLSRLVAVEMRDGKPGTPQELFQLAQGTTWDVTPSPDRFLAELLVGNGGSTIATVTNWFEELRRRAPASRPER
ncbi:MAG: protein kinase domain-containing protein [Betaproteobacteria bacterium]